MLNAASGQSSTCRLLVVTLGLTPDGGHLTSGTAGPREGCPYVGQASEVHPDGVCGMPEAVETKWPVLALHERALEWLRIWTDMGRAPRTIDAYSRGLAEYLQVCEREGIDPLTATRAHVAMFVRELTSRPSRRGTNVVALDSGSGLANATLQQRLVPVRLFYDFLGSKKGCGSRILLGGAVIRLAGRVGGRARWCRGS